MNKPRPVADMHCDLLAYLASNSRAESHTLQDIGCSMPFLRDGNVKLQVTAIYSGGGKNSTSLTKDQCSCFENLVTKNGQFFHRFTGVDMVYESMRAPGTMIVAAIENASALCTDDEPLETAFERLEAILSDIGPIIYISLTHHGENRFGGGNSTDAGLKDDGRVLLDYIDSKGIAIDLSHTSDALARGIIDHIIRRGLDIPIIASHSNFRSIHASKRNLPDDLAKVIIDMKGLIGINFLRAYLHPDDPSSLTRHILHGVELGAKDALCFGADFFDTSSHPDPSRAPFFFKEHENAGKYQSVLDSLERVLKIDQIEALAFGNVMNFLQRLWSGRTATERKIGES